MACFLQVKHLTGGLPTSQRQLPRLSCVPSSTPRLHSVPLLSLGSPRRLARSVVLFASPKDEQQPPQKAEDLLLAKSAGLLKGLSFCAFWLQLALSLVSTGVLLFSQAVGGPKGGLAFDVAKGFAVGSVVLSFVSTFFAHGFLRISRRLEAGGVADAAGLAANLLRNSTVNLFGIALTTFGLQASVGTLVGKTLLTASQSPFQPGAPGASFVSLDVFALQASTNVLLGHLVGLCFCNIALRVVNSVTAKKAATA